MLAVRRPCSGLVLIQRMSPVGVDRFGPDRTFSTSGGPPGKPCFVFILVIKLLVERVVGGDSSGRPPGDKTGFVFTLIDLIGIVSQWIWQPPAVCGSFPGNRRRILEFVARVETLKAGARLADDAVALGVGQTPRSSIGRRFRFTRRLVRQLLDGFAQSVGLDALLPDGGRLNNRRSPRFGRFHGPFVVGRFVVRIGLPL
jgi:hypothetical protein